MIEMMNKTEKHVGIQDGQSSQRIATQEAQDHSEGFVARSIEKQTAKIPSDVWLWSALGSMGLSLFLHMTDKKKEGLFVGQWAAPLLILGLYNKVVKVAGSDRVHSQPSSAK